MPMLFAIAVGQRHLFHKFSSWLEHSRSRRLQDGAFMAMLLDSYIVEVGQPWWLTDKEASQPESTQVKATPKDSAFPSVFRHFHDTISYKTAMTLYFIPFHSKGRTSYIHKYTYIHTYLFCIIAWCTTLRKRPADQQALAQIHQIQHNTTSFTMTGAATRNCSEGLSPRLVWSFPISMNPVLALSRVPWWPSPKML